MKRRLKLARVRAKVYLNGQLPNARPITEIKTLMTTDLPAENLGELLCQAVEAAWKAGHDPVSFCVIIEFA